MSKPAMPTRREVLGNGAAGLLTFWVGGCATPMTPKQARTARLPMQVLTPEQALTLDALGEILVPGSMQAGLSHFIDQQLATAPTQQLLMLKYLGVSPPFAPFYQGALAGVERAAQHQHRRNFSQLSSTRAQTLVRQMSAGEVDGWEGPPAGFAYFVLRNDAVDVTYGTPSGFEQLGVPYMAHIQPPEGWQQ